MFEGKENGGRNGSMICVMISNFTALWQEISARDEAQKLLLMSQVRYLLL